MKNNLTIKNILTLNLQDNQLTVIDEKLFIYATNIIVLNLRNNMLKELPNTISNLTGLNELNISMN